MAPEQKTAPDAAGPAADIYSLSRMFYELLMDVLPEGPWQAPSKHRPDIPSGIDVLLEKGLSNRPRSRQQSVAEYEAELTKALAIEEEPAQPPVEPPPPNPIIAFLEQHFKKDGRWDTMKITSVAAAVVTALILIELIPTEPDPPPDTTSTVQVGGAWYVVSSTAAGFQTCNRWQISQNGQTITGRSGIWTFKGRFNGAVLQGTNRNTTNGAEFRVFSRLVDKGGRYDFVHGGTTMHVNHPPGGIAC